MFQSVLELMRIIGPTIAQLPQDDRGAVCRKLLQFMEVEEASLFSSEQQIDALVAPAQGHADARSHLQPSSESKAFHSSSKPVSHCRHASPKYPQTI
jgi:hypothetical protein